MVVMALRWDRYMFAAVRSNLKIACSPDLPPIVLAVPLAALLL